MLELVLDRKYPRDKYTIGKMYVNGALFSDTIEDKDRGLLQSMSLSEIQQKKVYGETAIPKGYYRVKLTYSPKFASRTYGKRYKGLIPEIMDVKGYSGVRIHPFNTAEESLGCIAVGVNSQVGKVTQSTKYFYELMDKYIVPATNRGEDIWISII